LDADGDGSTSDVDCDDADAAVFPGAEERCDSIDNNCDGDVDDGAVDAGTWYVDGDSDGYGDPSLPLLACEAPAGAVADSSDCDDSDADIQPLASEVCDGVDNNCDSLTDDEDPGLDGSTSSTWYADLDSDGYGDSASAALSCAAPSGSVAVGGDCDDSDAALNPGAAEICNDQDDNCDGLADDADPALDPDSAITWYRDADGDLYGDPASTVEACDRPSGYRANRRDCDDSAAAVYPGATEVCDSVDNDCDSLTDDADSGLDPSTASAWYTDADADGYGDPDSEVLACEAPAGTISDGQDCDDSDAEAWPGADEPCSAGADLDCDGAVADTCTSCLEWLNDGGAIASGLYTIDPDGASALGEQEVWCDMDTDGGGWTLVQRTVWDWAESSELWTDYSSWLTDTVGDASPGSAFRLEGWAWEELDDEADHMLRHTPRDRSSGGDCDTLTYLGSGSTFNISLVGTYISPMTSTVRFTDTAALSTTDSGPSRACVTGYGAVPWFYSSCCTTCPTFKGYYWSDEPHPMASYLDTTADHFGQTTATACPSGGAAVSSGYEGINSMEYYLR
jgi:hypothetical protein